jgi:hypothetical protein
MQIDHFASVILVGTRKRVLDYRPLSSIQVILQQSGCCGKGITVDGLLIVAFSSGLLRIN